MGGAVVGGAVVGVAVVGGTDVVVGGALDGGAVVEGAGAAGVVDAGADCSAPTSDEAESVVSEPQAAPVRSATEASIRVTNWRER